MNNPGGQFNHAMLQSIMRSVFSQPATPNAGMKQTGQGFMGHLGGTQGIPQGAVGAAVPQMGTPAPGTAPKPQSQPAGGGPGGPAAPSSSGQPNAPQGGGLAALLPLLGMLLPALLKGLGALGQHSMSQGGGAGAPQGGGMPQLGPQPATTSRAPGTI